MIIQDFYDAASNTFTYCAYDERSKEVAIYDSVMNLDPNNAKITFESADKIIQFVRENDLKCKYVIETHVHADHLSAAPYIQSKLGGELMIGREILQVQEIFGKIFNEGTEFQRDGSQFDILVSDGDTYYIGDTECTTIATPGHTPACYSHQIDTKPNASIIVGDTLFMPDSGTARCDFPGGSAEQLWNSIQKILSLPEETKIYICHDYQPGGREPLNVATIKEHLDNNIHVKSGSDKQSYIKTREERDATLSVPRLIIPSIQSNMRAGNLPEDSDGNKRFTYPINKF